MLRLRKTTQRIRTELMSFFNKYVLNEHDKTKFAAQNDLTLNWNILLWWNYENLWAPEREQVEWKAITWR